MSAILSKSSEYATQALLYLARRNDPSPVLLREISDALQIPHHFLSKILQQLVREGLVVSHKGANGGFSLGKAAERISLLDIVSAVEGKAFMTGCVLGFPNCGDRNPCPIHNQWKEARANLLEMLGAQSIDVLSRSMDGKIEEIERIAKAHAKASTPR